MSISEAARRNVELKATDPDPERSLRVCRRLGAADRGVIQQCDTYFYVGRRGLKLREETPGRPHLIQFERADRPEQRQSSYRIVQVEDGTSLRAALELALGVRGVVEKRRHLFLWRDVRIHLDEVNGLGTFVEFEAVASPELDLTESIDWLRSCVMPSKSLMSACAGRGTPANSACEGDTRVQADRPPFLRAMP